MGGQIPCTRLLLAFAISFYGCRVSGYSSGPPLSACPRMEPDPQAHGSAPQSSPVPFKLEVGQASVPAGGIVDLKVVKKDPSGPDFKGFMVQAVDAGSQEIVGSFEVSDGSINGMACGSVTDGTVSHANPAAKSSVSLRWKAPLQVQGDTEVNFFFTVVVSKSTYWVKQPSDTKVVVEEGGQTEPPSPEPPSTEPPSPELLSPSPSEEALYRDCSKSKGCFGFSPDCLRERNCRLLVTYSDRKEDSRIAFELHSLDLPNGQYQAVGISRDKSMGDDLVLACSNVANSVSVSWNSGKSNLKGVTGLKLEDVQVISKDGGATCKFSLPYSITVQLPNGGDPGTFELATEKYFLLMSQGPLQGDELSYHGNDRVFSGEAIDLTSTSSSSSKGEDRVLIKVHGCLMVIAWVGCASVGMVVARYYKNTWKSVKPMGKDLWFRGHQLLMGSCAFLTVVALIVIIVDAGFWPYDYSFVKAYPHPAVGVACSICALIQPVMAAARPHPGQSKRWIFNWAHWFVGNSAYILAIATIFLASDLKQARLPSTTVIVLAVLCCGHFALHLLLTSQTLLLNFRKAADEENGDAAGSAVRRIVLMVYFAFIFSIVICLLVFINLESDNTVDGETGSEGDGQAEPEG